MALWPLVVRDRSTGTYRDQGPEGVTVLGLEYLQENSRKNTPEYCTRVMVEELDGGHQAALADFDTGEFYRYICEMCCYGLRRKCGGV
jgi:hypothetical protein